MFYNSVTEMEFDVCRISQTVTMYQEENGRKFIGQVDFDTIDDIREENFTITATDKEIFQYIDEQVKNNAFWVSLDLA